MTPLCAILAAATFASLCLVAFGRARIAALTAELLQARRELQAKDESLRAALAEGQAARAALESERALLDARFAKLSSEALAQNTRQFAELADQVVRRAEQASKSELERREQALAQMVRPVQESLGRVDANIQKLEKSAGISSAVLARQLENVVASEERLRSETARLATALRAPAQRGRWGETQLRRTLELAGLRAHVDFDEQPVAQMPDGLLRPDVAVRLPGGKTVLLDAKVPLEAYLRAIEAPEPERPALLRAHAVQLRAHIDSLARKQYWEAFPGSPEMAVLFLPGEGLLASALEVDPSLHEDAFARRIVLATPSTLLALLLTIAHVWKQESIALNAREIANEGRELHKRIADLSRHLAKLGRALEGALKTYNAAVGSFDTRLLPAARRFEELKAAAVDVQLEPLAEVEVLPRSPRAAEEEGPLDDAN